MKRAYSPKDIAAKKWVTLPWGEKWNKPFGFPAENASWFISGASASGKSSFVMQLSKELCKYGLVLYLSYEEGVNQTFQRRMEYLKMNEVQGKFRVVVDETYEELIDRLKRPKSPKFIIVDSYQVSEWEYPDAVALMKRFPKKCFIWKQPGKCTRNRSTAQNSQTDGTTDRSSLAARGSILQPVVDRLWGEHGICRRFPLYSDPGSRMVLYTCRRTGKHRSL